MMLRLLIFSLALVLAGCGQPASQPPAKSGVPGFVLTSPVFSNNEAIPTKYTADGQGISPPLAWTSAPETTNGFALIMDDPDAPRGTYTHWVVYRLPPGSTSLAEDISRSGVAVTDYPYQGLNSAGSRGYTPPSPPPGKAHHYIFHLYALDAPVNLPPGAGADDLRKAIDGHVLATAELTGTYQRTR